MIYDSNGKKVDLTNVKAEAAALQTAIYVAKNERMPHERRTDGVNIAINSIQERASLGLQSEATSRILTGKYKWVE